ncbi:MAG TPA: CRTAC1 family protein [Acidobacteriaceae bacterium]
MKLSLLLILGMASAAVGQATPNTPPAAKSAKTGSAAPIRFEDATAKAGLDATDSFGSAQLGSLLEGTGAGCVWFDYNNDGLPDLYVLSGRTLPPGMTPHPLTTAPDPPPQNHLYRNNGDGTFTDVTEKAGLNPDLYSVAVTAADYDNDGYEDLLVTGYGRVILYHNNGNGTFTDVTAKAGINVDGWAISSTWLDYDKDGCVDLFVGRYVKFDPKYRNYYAADNYPGPLDYEGETNRLFHNNCDETFTDVSEKSGIAAAIGRTMGVTAADFDGDGWPDIYVANDKTENFLFRNKHDGTFEEVATDAGVAYGQDGEATSSMGPVFADITGSGLLDLWVSDGHYNRLMKNNGKGAFDDIGILSGLSQANAQYVSWGTGVYDFDNDGWLDILAFHGGLIHLIPMEHSVFRGLGQGKFEDVSETAGQPVNRRTVARGACFADYDNDGRVDAFLVNLGANDTLLHNMSPSTGHWIAISLRGARRSDNRSGSNRDGIGARVEVWSGGREHVAERVASSGYLSQDDGRMHFGLGAVAKVDRIVVHWPSGKVQTLENVGVDRVLTVEEPR